MSAEQSKTDNSLTVTTVVASGTAGGGERYLVVLGSRMQHLGHRLRLVGHVPGWYEAGLPGLRVDVGPKWSTRRVGSTVMRMGTERSRLVAAAAAISGDVATDVFHAQYKREQLLCSGLLADSAPVVWTEHGMLPAVPGAGAVLTWYRRAAIRSVHSIICVSTAVRDDVHRLLGGKGPILHVVENGVDCSRFTPATPDQKVRARHRFGVPEQQLTMVVACRLDRTKRVDLALATASELPNAVVLVAGTGSEIGRLQSIAPPNVRFVGFQEDPLDVYRAADVHLFTSSGAGEGLPLSLLESAACGVPSVIAVDAGLPWDVIEGAGAAAPATSRDFARAVDLVCTQARATSVRTWAELHDLPAWTNRHVDVFRDARRHGSGGSTAGSRSAQ